MSVSIDPKTIQEVKEKADIVEVISEHVVLKKRGREFVGKNFTWDIVTRKMLNEFDNMIK